MISKSELSIEGDAAVSNDPESTGAIDRFVSSVVAHWRPVALAASVLASVGLAVFLFLAEYLPDRQIDEAAARTVIAAASEGAVAALSYSSDSLDRDFTRARSHLTGDFLAYYDKFTKDYVVPAVKDKHLSQTAAVVRAAVSELDAGSAVVLIFLNETTLSKDKPQPLMTPSGVRITLTKVRGSWLISKLDPVV
ncbi:twin-arginine translocation pathway signal [Candidatus Mycobacterium wuenschmannii]|uniref:Twin-arginine translocation pathway signal n=1 Tax=Candidatus Mycobacterium wuenschmannii TaxID=3027808 RepID=A0ABY8VSG0_9MYCO|nr:twin-arginine translocation pathway signal [Candidatus Mycobacterium wuenschmannii]WIM86021.1 twin-arginine translocation pathway signal [Candidatus Mycobacterium wuenschmannii]